MRRFRYILMALLLFLSVSAEAKTRRAEVLLVTTEGNIRLQLYNETPLHRDQFLRNVKQHVYDGVLFHRVINQFMIQSGDPLSKDAAPGVMLGDGNETKADWVEAEFRIPEFFHRRGVLAAAREGDEVNPEKKSSSTQFYIVTGRTFEDAQLERMLQTIKARTGTAPTMTAEMREAYKTIGGTPHLDGTYTVYGEVVEGMDVVDKIQVAETDRNDRPLNDIRILKAQLVKKYKYPKKKQ